MASGWNLWVWLVSVVVRRYIIDILIIIITFPYSTCISSFFGSIIPISLFIFKCFFVLVYIYIVQYRTKVSFIKKRWTSRVKRVQKRNVLLCQLDYRYILLIHSCVECEYSDRSCYALIHAFTVILVLNVWTRACTLSWYCLNGAYSYA